MRAHRSGARFGRIIVAVAALGIGVQLGAMQVGGAAPAPRSLAPGDHSITLTVDHMVRNLILHVPPHAVANRPLLLIYHGATDTAKSTEHGTDFVSVADRTGELVAFLQGYAKTWNYGTGEDPAAQAHVNDLAYTTAVIAKLETLVPFDHKRIVAVGFSNGALMTEYLGCKLAGRFALFVPIEGELATATSASCAPSRPVSVYEIHGTSDATIYYNGGPINGVKGGTTVLSAPHSVARWAQLDHCAATPKRTTVSSTIKLTTYAKCRNGVHVVLRTIVGGVHQWGSNVGDVVASVLPPA